MVQNATLHNADEIARLRRAHRRHGDRSSAPATSSRRSSASCWRSGRRAPSPTSFPTICPACCRPTVVREINADRRGGRACALHRRVHLPVPGDRAAAGISSRAAPSTSRASARSRSSCSSSEGWVKEPADIFTLEARNARRSSSRSVEGYGETSVAQPVRRHRGAARDLARPLHLRARHPPRRRDHGARARARLRHMAGVSRRRAQGRRGRRARRVAEMDDARPDRRDGDRQRSSPISTRRTTAASSSG